MIGTRWAVEVGLSSNRVAARQLLSRDCRVGMLEAVPTYPRSYKLIVTLVGAAEPVELGKDIPTIQILPNLNVDGGQIALSVQNKTTLVCNAYQRVKRYRERQKKQYIPTLACAYQYGEIGRRARTSDRGFYDALDTALQLPALAHNLAFMLHTLQAPDPTLFDDIHTRNKCLTYPISVNGFKVTVKLYPTGALELQPNLDESPLSWDAIGSFMRDIQASLPYSTPPIATWLITCTDPNLPDVDVTGQSWAKHFKMPIFPHKGSKVHVYVKNYAGKTWLRVELYQENPDCTLSGYAGFMERAERKLLEAIGK